MSSHCSYNITSIFYIAGNSGFFNRAFSLPASGYPAAALKAQAQPPLPFTTSLHPVPKAKHPEQPFSLVGLPAIFETRRAHRIPHHSCRKVALPTISLEQPSLATVNVPRWILFVKELQSLCNAAHIIARTTRLQPTPS